MLSIDEENSRLRKYNDDDEDDYDDDDYDDDDTEFQEWSLATSVDLKNCTSNDISNTITDENALVFQASEYGTPNDVIDMIQLLMITTTITMTMVK